MGIPVAELQRRMSSREFAEWLAFMNLEPLGAERADLQAGIIAATVANAHRDPKQRRQPYQPGDFIPDYDPQPEKTGQDLLAIVELINAGLGGRDLRGANNGNIGKPGR